MVPSVIERFEVERWMDEYEVTAKYNIAETCAASISIDDICAFARIEPNSIFSASQKLTYGAIYGSDALRSNLATVYNAAIPKKLDAENLLITNGAIGANFAVLYSLICQGDHVICMHPTYQQLYSVPKSFGADVELWRTLPGKNWELDINTLKQMIKPESKMIILNNPQNPTGQVITKSTLSAIIEIARERDLYVLVDEVYRPLFHGINLTDPEYPPPALYWNYDKIISTGSMSKAYSMAGIRVGWIACHSKAILEACAGARDYTLISVSQLDDRLATVATSKACIEKIVERNMRLAQKNLGLLDQFVKDSNGRCEYVKPKAGTTAMVKFTRDGRPVDDIELCKKAHSRGAFMVPANLCFADGGDFRGYVRIGYVCSTEELEAGLKVLGEFMNNGYDNVPLAK